MEESASMQHPFEDTCYYNPNDKSSKLYDNAIPTIIDVPNPPKLINSSRKPPKRRPIMNFNPDVSSSKKLIVHTNMILPVSSDNHEAIVTLNESRNVPSDIESSGQQIENKSSEVPLLGVRNSRKTDVSLTARFHSCAWKSMYKKTKSKNWKLYGEINRLKKQVKNLKNRNISSKEKSCQLPSSELDVLPEKVLDFVKSQIRHSKTKKHGMR